MLRRFFHRQIDAREKLLGVPLDYLHHMADTSPAATVKFGLFMPMSQHRKVLPASVYHVAALVASRAQDCGTCVQIGVNVAHYERVPAFIIEAVLHDDADALSQELADVYHYACAMVQQQDDPTLRETLRNRYGDEGLIELAFALAAAQVYPVVKRALGYALACSRVEVKMQDTTINTSALVTAE